MKLPEPNLVLKEEAFAIVGAAMEVINSLGHGFNEKAYENALVIEFRLRGFPSAQQPRFPLEYKGSRVGEFIPDLIAYDQVVVDAKTRDRITDHEVGQMLNCLRITKLPLGLILNFEHAKLESRRVVL